MPEPTDSAPGHPGEHQDEEHARRDLLERINAAGVTTLGHVATIIDGEPASTEDYSADDPNDDQEPDTFPWGDAARWYPDGGPDELAPDLVDELFGEVPDDEIGTVEDIGWFGLLRHGDRPGGFVISQNEYGFRRVWEAHADEEMAQHWEELQGEYEAFIEATQAHNRRPGERGDGENDGDGGREREPREHLPEIWVGSLSDYNNGRLHGAWLDATLDAGELQRAIAYLLRHSGEADAEEYGIFDYSDFCGVHVDEYENLEVVSRIAQGIAEHGEAFAKWVEYVGERDEEALERFEDHYLGSFDSSEAYVEDMLEQGDAYEFLKYIPEWLQPYVQVDTEMLARDMEIEGLHVAEAYAGGVHVFDPRR